MFEAVRPSLEFPKHVTLLPDQQTALLLALEDWSGDLDADEAMPQELVELRNVLVEHRHDAEWRAE
jgi:hypothetical protein